MAMHEDEDSMEIPNEKRKKITPLSISGMPPQIPFNESMIIIKRDIKRDTKREIYSLPDDTDDSKKYREYFGKDIPKKSSMIPLASGGLASLSVGLYEDFPEKTPLFPVSVLITDAFFGRGDTPLIETRNQLGIHVAATATEPLGYTPYPAQTFQFHYLTMPEMDKIMGEFWVQRPEDMKKMHGLAQRLPNTGKLTLARNPLYDITIPFPFGAVHYSRKPINSKQYLCDFK